jgi:hypothetical protein
VSKYFQVLERLERTRGQDPGPRPVDGPETREGSDRTSPRTVARPPRSPKPVVEPSKPAVTENAKPAAMESVAPVQSAPTSEAPEVRVGTSPRAEPLAPPAFAPLRGVDAVFNNIAALSMGRRPMTLAFAAASATPAVEALTASLGACAEAKGERVMVAELCDMDGERVLVCRQSPGGTSLCDDADRGPLPLDLHGGPSRESLLAWRDRVGPGADLIFIIGPPLADSVDSALLASLCDGLVIVAVHEETHRAALALASERARLTRRPALAVVVNNSRDKPPSWFRRIVDR